MHISKMDESKGFTVDQLILMLIKAKRKNKLETFYKKLSKINLVILGELGYVLLNIEGACLLFWVIVDCYKKQSSITA